ncbi:VWA domain-containing protein, partial [Vibrio caribbeanicus]|uniref:VWA domain-containing protein n=1 Tax=Vibrio caribbeanicus TaxID=701175 RepID=UPI0030DCF3CF
ATNTAPTINLTANDLTEDSGVIVGSPAATNSVTDAQNDAITVDFKEGTNTNGHYTLNTATNTVVLTQKGLDLVNDGLALDTIELVAKENDSSLFGSASATPNIIQTNDAPTIENVTTGSVSEEGLASGIQDNLGSPDTTNDTSVNGSFVISDVDSDSLTVSLTGPDGLTSGGESITWSWNAVDNKLTGSTSTGTVMEITVTEPNDNGKGTWDYTATLLKPLDHQNDTSEDALSVNLGIVASDGSIETNTPLVISVEDDALVVTDKAAVDFTLNNLPDVVTGQVSFRGNSGSSNTAQLLADKGIIVTALGFTSYESNVLGAADVNQSQHGIGVHSSASLGFPLSNEVDYRFANNSDGKPGLSEELIIDLQGKVAFGAAIEFDKMFSNEPENGVATFYRNGVEVFEQTFSSDKTSGDYAKNFDVHEGGFDKIVLKATGNGNTASQQDNSDFTVASITFPDPSDKTMIARAEGTLQIEYGADGFGSVGNLDLVEAETGLKTANGHDVVVSVNANDKNSLVGRDTNGQLVFEVHLTPTTGQWEFFQYESMLVPQGDNDIDFTFVATDGDGDKVTGVFSVNPFTRPVINVDGKVLIEDDGVAEGTVAASYSTHYENSEVTVTITEGTDPNAYYTLDSVNQTVKLTEAGAAEVNAGNSLPPVSLTVVHNSANTSLEGIGTDTPEVTQVNDAPVLEEITFAASGKEDEVIQLNLSELNITDEEGDSSFISDITVAPQFGEITLTRDSSNKVTGAEFKPAADRHFIGDNNVPLEVTVSDGDKQSTATVRLNVEAQVDRAVVTATMSDSPEVNSSITKYPVDINIELLDRDGSERIETVTISGLYHSTLFADGVLIGTADQHGNITIPGNVWDNDAQLYIKILNEYGGVAQDTKPDITVTATIIEQSTGEQKTSSDTISLNEVISHEGTEGQFNTLLGEANDIVIGDLQGAVVTPGKSHNVAFMVDTSGSMSSSDMTEIKNQLKSVMVQLKDSVSGEHAGEVNVFIADFDNPTRALISVKLDDSNALQTLNTMIDSMSRGGGTNYEDVFKTTANWFESDQAKSNTDAINIAYFVTDGHATAYSEDVSTVNWFVSNDQNTWTRVSELVSNLNGTIDAPIIFTSHSGIPQYSTNGIVERDFKIETDGRIYIEGATGVWRNTPYHVRPDGDGGFEVVDLVGGYYVDSIDYQQASEAFNQHLKAHVTVEAIGIGQNVATNYLDDFDSDTMVANKIDVTQLADTIMGKVSNLVPTEDSIRGNDGDDILFGDNIMLPDTGGQGYQAIESYVADKLGLETVNSAQVSHYVREHASEFEYSTQDQKDDFLEGRKGSDVLFGQGGDDQLHGGKGNDMLIGGLGDDILTGGEGSDLFKWIDVEHGATDVIKDFDLEHGDRIDLS